MFYKNEFFEIVIQDSTQSIDTKLYRSFLKSQELRLLKQKQLEAIAQTGFHKVLIDFQLLSVISPQDQNWLAKDWFPQAENTGLKYFAFINSDNTFGNYALKRVQREAEVQQLLIRDFACADSAKRWLEA